MDELVEELQAIADLAKDTPINGFPNLNNKWLARSGLQKAIRRGRTQEALTCGANLATADPDGAWRALATVIVEDVGFGDLDLLALSTVAGLKTVRQKVTTPGRLFMGMVVRACGAVKTRSACELSLGADKDPVTPWAALHASPDDELMTLMRDTKLAISIQYAATVLVRRRCAKTPGLMNKALELMMEQLGTGPRGEGGDDVVRAPGRHDEQRDLAAAELGRSTRSRWQPDPLPPEKVIAGVSSAAFDMHTLQGKKAIKAFHTSMVKKGSKAMAALGEKSEDVVRALGSIIFIVEGGQLDRRLVSPSLTR